MIHYALIFDVLIIRLFGFIPFLNKKKKKEEEDCSKIRANRIERKKKSLIF